MCTVFVIRDPLAAAPVLLAANRDEMNDRPWRGPRWQGDVLAPTDVTAGGTWIGMNRHGWCFALTNRVFEPVVDARRSRGLLARDVLASRDVAQARDRLAQAVEREPYNAFNAIIAAPAGAWTLTVGDDVRRWTTLGAGVHVVTSRHDVDAPICEEDRMRVERIAMGRDGSVEALLPELRLILGDHRVRDDGSSICKHGDVYGTRSAAVIGLWPGAVGRLWFAPGRPCETAFAHEAPWTTAVGGPRAP